VPEQTELLAALRIGDPTLFKLHNPENSIVDEVLSDEPLQAGSIVKTRWRVVKDLWGPIDAGNNRVPSGGVLVEPVSPEHMNPRKAI
jgi:hypothetical protein